MIRLSFTCIRNGQRLPQFTVQALQTIRSWLFSLRYCVSLAITLKGKVRFETASAAPADDALTKSRRLI